MRCGNHSARIGNAIRITSRIRSVATNGITPRKMVENDTSFTTLLITNTFMPTGGWIRPSSTVITMMTPNQIGSKPSWFGVIIVMTVELGLIHPPVGMNIFVIKSVIDDAKISTIFYGVMPFIVTDLVAVADV